MALTRGDMVAGLRALGLGLGDRVLVHSSLVALGKIEGGADAVIDALLEVVGEGGLVVVPTFACQPPFDRRTSSTPLGAIPNMLWQRPGAVRSLHPTHSVAALGKGAEDLIRDHEKAPTAYAEGTPYHTLATTGGKILLMGVDQDRNTTLHAAEALAGAAYLSDITGTYIDDAGKEVTIPIAAMAGPHRDFIGLDRLFRQHGIMQIGRIGEAVCRLIDGGPMLEVAVEALKADPAAVLCDNPACTDCVMQRGKIKAARLLEESFMLVAMVGDISDDPDEIIRALVSEGIDAVELTAAQFNAYGDALANNRIGIAAIHGSVDDQDAADLSHDLGVYMIVPVNTHEDCEKAIRLTRDGNIDVLMMNTGANADFYEDLYCTFEKAPRFAFNPGRFAAAGEKPFLEVFYRGGLRKQMDHFYIADETVWGTEPTLPGMGNGEVKEIISMLRCRSYRGVMTLRSPLGGIENFRATAAAFWKMLDNM